MSYEGPGRYRHYKGGEYEVLGLALQEDTVLKPHQPDSASTGPEKVFVIYRPLTPGSLLERRSERFWARELSDFNDLVGVPRFERIDTLADPVECAERAWIAADQGNWRDAIANLAQGLAALARRGE